MRHSPLPSLPAMLIFTVLAGCATPPPDAPPPPGTVAQPPGAASPAAGPAPGQWQLVLEVEDVRGGGKVPAQTMTLCSTPDDKKQWQDMVGGKSAAGCAVKDYTAAGETISYTMECGGGIEGRTMIRIADADHYAGESTLTLKGATQSSVIRSKVTATRLSPVCRK